MDNSPRSTADTRNAALTMWQGRVPCFMQMGDPSCEAHATVVAYYEHEELPANGATNECSGPDAMPLCAEHRDMVALGSRPFWRVWYAMETPKCTCGLPVRLQRFEALQG